MRTHAGGEGIGHLGRRRAWDGSQTLGMRGRLSQTWHVGKGFVPGCVLRTGQQVWARLPEIVPPFG